MSAPHPELPSVEQLFEEMPCGLLVTATDGTILRVNDTFCRWLGLPASDLVGLKRLQELFTMGARIFHQTHWLPMLQMQGSISEVKLDVRRRDGSTLPMLLNVVRRRSDVGTYDQISAFIAEDRNKYERELLAARKRADSLALLEQDRALFAEQMIGIVSHDLRNPLSVVLLAGKWLANGQRDLNSESSQRLLSNVIRAAERAQRLIADLLDFTAARVGRGLTVTRQPMNLHEVIERAIEELGVAFPGRSLQHSAQGDAVVHADADRMSQLLGNLVANAMAYGDPDGPVRVRTEVAGASAKLIVHNTGTPIESGTLATMFEPMVRGGTADQSKRSVGLGLFIVRAIAVAHGGDVEVSSGVEAGTEFVVSFPKTSTAQEAT